MNKEEILNDFLTWASYQARRFKNTPTDDLGKKLEELVEEFVENYKNNQPYL